MRDFRNLDVWQRARKLTKTVYEMTVDFPETEVFGLRSQMRRASGDPRSEPARRASGVRATVAES